MPSYTFYFEINKNNIGEVCSSLPHTKTWTGFDWTNANYISPIGCATFKSSNEPQTGTYPVDGSQLFGKTTTFPIKAIMNSEGFNDINTNEYIISRNDFDIKDLNSFFRWDEVKGTSDFSYTCGCSNLGVSVHTSGAKSYTNITCSGSDCQIWFPPLSVPIPRTANQNYHQLNNTPPTIACWDGIKRDSTGGDGTPTFSGIINKGNVTYTFPVYKPNSYTTLPQLNSNNEYVPNPNIKGGAFYNCGPFKALLQLTNNNMNDTGTINGVCSCDSVPSSNPDSYTIYQVRYNIPTSIISQNYYYNYLMDFLYLQQYLFYNYTSSFLQSEYWETTLDNIKQLIIDYCNYTSNMTNKLCYDSFSDFIFLSSSPCTNPYSTCSKGWGNYCFNENNFTSPLCLNYYSNSYIPSINPNNSNSLLDDNVVNGLQKTCQNIFSQVENPITDLDQEYWNVCSCFLPNEYYQNYLKENNLQNLSLGSQQCWYLPCSNASIVPKSNPICPNNSITNCVQDVYVTIKTDNPSNIQNDMIQTTQTITSCGTKSVEPISSVSVNNIVNTNGMFTTPEPIEDTLSGLELTFPPNKDKRFLSRQGVLSSPSSRQNNLLQSNKQNLEENEMTTTEAPQSSIIKYIIIVSFVFIFISFFGYIISKFLQRSNKKK